jgi:hypothetical protein
MRKSLANPHCPAAQRTVQGAPVFTQITKTTTIKG